MAKYHTGELTDRVKIFRQVKTADGQGGFTRANVLQYTLWALVIVKGGAEVFKNDKIDATALYTFVVRAIKSLVVQDDDIIEWKGVQYNIRAVRIKSSRKLFMEIDAEKGVAQ